MHLPFVAAIREGAALGARASVGRIGRAQTANIDPTRLVRLKAAILAFAVAPRPAANAVNGFGL